MSDECQALIVFEQMSERGELSFVAKMACQVLACKDSHAILICSFKPEGRVCPAFKSMLDVL